MAQSKTSASRRPRKRNNRTVTNGIMHVSASFNNTLITVTDCSGNTLAAASAGSSGFKGSRKSTPFAAQVAADKVGSFVRDELGMRILTIYIKGPGPGRDAVLRAVGTLGFQVPRIEDKTGLPFNGCRRRKRRRV